MRYLTKSRFTTAITCPTKLAYLDDKSYANTNIDNEFLSALADGGHQVGALAKCLFPEGIEIDAVGHDAQVAQTNALLARDEVVLFEAAVRVGRLFVRVDLLRKRGSSIELYEVKAKSFDSRDGSGQILKRTGIASEFKPYLYDVAFQRHVLRRAFPDATITSHLVMPDKAMECAEAQLAQRLRIVRTGERAVQIEIDASLRDGVLARQILHVLPVDDFLDVLTRGELEAGSYGWAFEDGIAELEARLDGPAFDPRAGAHCKACEFRATSADLQRNLRDGRPECWTALFRLPAEAFSRGTVFDLNNFRGANGVIQAGKIALPDLEPEDVKYKQEPGKISSSHRQWLQCEESRDVIARPVVISDVLATKLAALQYPLHFIDFETATPTLPFHAGRRPYEQLLFQFSHHRMERDGQVAHATQHLDSRPGEFPNFDAVRALSHAIGDDHGSVIHWWTHERTILSKVRGQLFASPAPPDDRDALVAFIDSLIGTEATPGRLVDLGQHITHPLVFLPGTNGSSSIKKILPAILNSSAMLQHRYGQPLYGAPGGIPSLNFREHAWVLLDGQGRVNDPYSLLAGRFINADFDALEDLEDGHPAVANGGAAMVAYSLLQSDLLDASAREELEQQLLRYCELDTLAMVMVFEGLQEQVAQAA